MSFLDRVLREPQYGWVDSRGELSKPTARQLFAELLRRVNPFRTRKNWQAFSMWVFTGSLAPFLLVFLVYHFSWPLVLVGFLYSMVLMGSYGTVWLHRYATHGAFRFESRWWRFVTRNLVIRVCPDEIYVISHHVHHARSEKPGDPYNPLAGPLYCFLADTNHQPIATELSEDDYARVCRLLARTGEPHHTYEEYQRWGTAERPLRTYLSFLGNWAFWYGVFFLVGGHALATAMFGSALFWAVGIRTYNYGAHGAGKDRRREGVDFHRKDLSINQLWPGFVAGEWHNNHHLFPTSARNGFRWYQLDLPFLYIRFLERIGAVSRVRDHTELFRERHLRPYREATARAQVGANAAVEDAPRPVGSARPPASEPR
jgi:sn-1 stearoyl-lipid 9-desaturase